MSPQWDLIKPRETQQWDPMGHAVHQDDEYARFAKALSERRAQYPHVQTGEWNRLAGQLRTNGWGVVRDVLSKRQLRQLLERAEETVHLAPDRLGRHDEHYAEVAHPLVNVTGALELALDATIRGIAAEYFGCVPAIGSASLRLCKVTAESPLENQLFHVDDDSQDLLKFCVYLDDVDMGGGPVAYVEGSHIERFDGWSMKSGWAQSEVTAHYGEGKVRHLTGRAGDLVIVNANGFHRGSKPTSTRRWMLSVSYVVHPENWKQPGEYCGQILAQAAQRMRPEEQPCIEFLQPVEKE